MRVQSSTILRAAVSLCRRTYTTKVQRVLLMTPERTTMSSTVTCPNERPFAVFGYLGAAIDSGLLLHLKVCHRTSCSSTTRPRVGQQFHTVPCHIRCSSPDVNVIMVGEFVSEILWRGATLPSLCCRCSGNRDDASCWRPFANMQHYYTHHDNFLLHRYRIRRQSIPSLERIHRENRQHACHCGRWADSVPVMYEQLSTTQDEPD